MHFHLDNIHGKKKLHHPIHHLPSSLSFPLPHQPVMELNNSNDHHHQQSPPPNPFLQVSLNPDGTLARPLLPLSPPSSSPPVLSADFPLNPSRNTHVRVYTPLPDPPLRPSKSRLPLFLFFHGGGFILFSPATAPYHSFCERLALAVPAIVISVDYRLAPEHRLPAAYHDAADALLWLRSRAAEAREEEEASHPLSGADFSRVFLMGSSSGANIAYRAGLHPPADLGRRVTVAGLVLHQPYFGGEERTESEVKGEFDEHLPLRATDMMWQLSLPVGASRDHEYSNPIKEIGGEGEELEPMRRLPRCLVTGNSGDPLVDRQKEFARMLEGRGVRVVARLERSGHHAAELFDSTAAGALFDDVRRFLVVEDAVNVDV